MVMVERRVEKWWWWEQGQRQWWWQVQEKVQMQVWQPHQQCLSYPWLGQDRGQPQLRWWRGCHTP